ncbi:hypothetical protein BDV26DRAFT_261513 [Aspergillus bertholletiae]|uniref:Uncharacterized protein n=1 Tax=Aspergillus bertholletiae TaxID=1226010 RepID=A0A5N7B9Q1_9EURO|nr:hypothetical protein BDV26DRAFT_261513 [Aspergillus bertholletiae]
MGLVGGLCMCVCGCPLYYIPFFHPPPFCFSGVAIYKAISCHLSSIVLPYVFFIFGFAFDVSASIPTFALCFLPPPSLHHVTYCTCTLWPFGKSPDRNRVCFLLRSMLGYIFC